MAYLHSKCAVYFSGLPKSDVYNNNPYCILAWQQTCFELPFLNTTVCRNSINFACDLCVHHKIPFNTFMYPHMGTHAHMLRG